MAFQGMKPSFWSRNSFEEQKLGWH